MKAQYIKERKTKKGTLYYEVQIYDNRTGKTVCKSFSESKYGGKARALQFAKRYRDKTRGLILNGEIVVDNNNKTLSDIFDCAMDFDSGVLATRKKLLCTFNKYIKPYFTDSELFKNITSLDIQRNLNKISDLASADTIERTLCVWKKMYKVAIVKGFVYKDETVSVIKPKSNYVVKSREKITNYDEMMQVSKCLMERMESTREATLITCAMKILYHETIRPQEVFALSRKSIDLVNKEIRIFESIGSNMSENNVVKNPKTIESKRVLPMRLELVEVFKWLLESTDGDYFFVRDNGIMMSGNWASDAIRRYRPKDCTFTLYKLRHQITTDLIDKGVDLRTIQELMGHSTPKMTLEYARSNEAKKVDAINVR